MARLRKVWDGLGSFGKLWEGLGRLWEGPSKGFLKRVLREGPLTGFSKESFKRFLSKGSLKRVLLKDLFKV